MADPLSSVASIAGLIQITGLVAGAAYGYFSSVNGGKKEMENLWNELRDLEQVLRKLQINLINAQSSGHSTLMSPFHACYMEMIELQMKLTPRKKTISFMRRLKWPLKEKETALVILRIERHKSLFTLALTVDHQFLLRAVHAFSEDTNVTLSELVRSLKIEFLALRREQQDQAASRVGEKRASILSWLYPDAVDSRHIEIKGRRQKQTGQWLLHHPKFQKWAAGTSVDRLLWGHGIPGAGKTFLASLVIEELEARASEKHFGVAYIYFDFNEQQQQTPIRVIRSLIKQLMVQISSPDLPQEVEKLYDELRPNGKTPTLEGLQHALLATSSLFPHVFFILDALDECDEKSQRKELLPFFHSLARNGASLFLTSRPYPRDISESLKGNFVSELELAATGGDIKIYVEEVINGNSHANALIKGDLRDRIISKLVDCCNGMFLLVHFHIEDLCQYTTIKQVDTALGHLNNALRTDQPLDGIYNRAMNNIAERQHPSRARLALKVLAWLVKSKNILGVDDLRMAVSVDSTNQSLPKEEDMPDDAMIVEVCGGLVVIDGTSNTIRLAHYSVQEYLIGYSVISKAADLNIITTYTTIFTFKEFSAYHKLEEITSLLSSNMLLFYAALDLEVHLQDCNEESSTEVYLAFLRNKSALSLYQSARDAMFLSDFNGPNNAPGIPAQFSIRYSRRTFTKGDSPLLEASRVGHFTVVKTLLEDGYDVSVKDLQGRTPLHLASLKGHLSVARLLLERGADIEALANGLTPLFFAVFYNKEDIIRMLLENGAQVSSSPSTGNTPLHIAVAHAQETVIKLLIQSGASTTICNLKGHSPLDYAVKSPLGHIINLLGQDRVMATSSTSISRRLLNAAWSGEVSVVRSLIHENANISTVDDEGRTPIHRAAVKGHLEVVELLLEAGADVLAIDNGGSTALHYAASNHCIKVARLLINAGSDVLATDNLLRTPLDAAVYYVREYGSEIIDLLKPLELHGKNRLAKEAQDKRAGDIMPLS